jgi:catechol 2,3-dioxygenase-like lactoylglutathione lyase family enzyme
VTYSRPVLHVETMDHIVLLVADVERSMAWYHDVLGLDTVRLEEWRLGRVPFPSVRVNEGTIIDILARPAGDATTGRNLDHLCLTVASTDLDAVVASGQFDVIEGPVRRFGARGDATSIYVRDPDRNVVEIRHYG